MPLASRASTARVARTQPDAAQKEDANTSADVRDDIQPRRGAAQAAQKPVSAPPPPASEQQAPERENSAQSDAQASERRVAKAPELGAGYGKDMPKAPERAPRKPRTPRANPAQIGAITEGSLSKEQMAALKQRQKEIEGEFKGLAGKEAAEMREVAQKFKTLRVALESEHREIANKLSAAIFRG